MSIIARFAAAAISTAACAGIASAAIDWGDEFQEFTGPACWATPIDGGNMAWDLDAPHFQKTAGGPVLAKSIKFDPKSGVSLLELAVQADRGIRAAASTGNIAIAPSTIVLLEINQDAPADHVWKAMAAVPVMAGETKAPRPEWGVERMDFPATTVAHLRHQGSIEGINPGIEKINNFVIDANKNGEKLDYGVFQVFEFYNLEEDIKGGDALLELCIQLKQG